MENEFILTIDLSNNEIDLIPLQEQIAPPQGLYVSHLTGSKQQMETIRREMINSTLNRILKRTK